MSYQNFIPTVWAEEINRELEKSFVFAEDCNRKYEGKVKQKGDSVRILGVGKPTITRTEDKNIVLGDAETLEDTSITLQVNQIAYYNYKVDDIDKRQAVGGVMEALSKETSVGLSDEMDNHIASMALSNDAVLHSKVAVQITKENVLQEFDKCIQKLWENNVKLSDEMIATVTPRFYNILKEAYIHLDTDNSNMLKNGKVGRYGNVIIKMSNNVAKSNNGLEDKIMIRTKNAVAFVNPMTHVEPYRPEKGFSDAVKGFVLFQAKIVRPKEMFILNVKY